MPIVIINGPTIQRLDALSLSDTLDCTAGTLISIISPAVWTAANLSFQISLDGVVFSNLFRVGKEVLVPCGSGRGILVRPDYYLRGMYVKFRSGTSASPVQQTAVRTFQVAIETP
jgi:hypothetical protein